MDLKDFTSETLRQIMDGVREAKEYGATVGADINPTNASLAGLKNVTVPTLYLHTTKVRAIVQDVSFDVAVTTTEGTHTEKGGKLGISVLSVGAGMDTDKTNSSVSRVQFKVPVFLP